MKYCTYRYNGRLYPGLLQADSVVDLSQNGRLPDLGALIQFLADGRKIIYGEELPLEEVQLAPPIPRPPKLIAVGLNYHDHAAEQGKSSPAHPLFFAKSRTSVCGPFDPIILPSQADRVDVEVELAVVFKQRGFCIKADEVDQYIFGFTILNDVSDRKIQRLEGQNYRAKSFPSFTPTGPIVITPDEFQPRSARIRLWNSGVLQQDSTLDRMIFSLPELICALSSFQEIEPGDILATGTPAGVGEHRNPPRFLKPGDLIKCEIENIGVLTNPVKGN